MKNRLVSVAFVFAAAGAAFGQASDDFNRPDGPIGGDWVAGFGTFGNFIVENNRGGHNVGANEGIVNSQTNSNYADVEHAIDVHINGTALQYVSLIIGRGGTNSLNIKVQSQTSNGFGHVGFYVNNGSNSPTIWPGSAPGFFEMVGIRFNDARMKVYFTNNGDTCNLEFDTNFDGIPEHTFQRHGVLVVAPTMGMQHGLGAFGPARFDNWMADNPTPPCYPDCDTSTGVGVLDIFDFLCFQNRYDAGSPYACDCDTTTGLGLCDIFDFLCFQNAYDAGCP